MFNSIQFQNFLPNSLNSKWMIYLLCGMLLWQLSGGAKSSLCYQLMINNASWTDRRPDFEVNMTFASNGAIGSNTVVNKEIAYPVVSINVQRTAEEKTSTLYNISAKLCDFQNLVNKIPMLKAVTQSSLKQNNLTFACPLKPGSYVMKGVHVSKGNPLLSFMYQPKSFYTFHGGMFEEIPASKTLSPLTTYTFIAKIVKKSCDRSD